jgi:hypothetical protein
MVLCRALHQGSTNPYGRAWSGPLLAWSGVYVSVILPDTDSDHVPIKLVNTTGNVKLDVPSNIPFAVSWLKPPTWQRTTTTWENWPSQHCQQLMYLK